MAYAVKLRKPAPGYSFLLLVRPSLWGNHCYPLRRIRSVWLFKNN